MIISQITGGLGNQMFQYAFGRRLAIHHNTELKLDVSFYANPKQNRSYGFVRTFDLGIFQTKFAVATSEETSTYSRWHKSDTLNAIRNRLFGRKKTLVLEPHYHFSEECYRAINDVYLCGYWQSERYFAEIESTLRSDFQFLLPPSREATRLLGKIQTCNSVCVHVRRGDFVFHPLNGTFGQDYYANATNIIKSTIDEPVYFVFSDDIEWCKANLRFDGPIEFVSDDFDGQKLQDDLLLMSSCKHMIIANSSFSWWAAWLNSRNDKVVVAPKNWVVDKTYNLVDLFPSSWIVI